MSKKKDTRQLLIESSEFTTKINVSKSLKESLEMSKGKAGTLIVRNVPCGLLNRVNQNNRIYSTKVVQDAINEAKRNHAFELKNMLGKPNEHPEGSYIAPSEASHVVIDAYVKPNVKILVDGKEEVNDVLFMDLEVLNTSNGKDMRALLEAECSVGTSIRGLGDLNGQNVENYTLISVDLVGNPSSSTYTRMIMSESVQVELKDPQELQETYTVTTSSTTVVKDLDTASQLQANLDNIGYGTVVKTSTKLDSETDPKTGAQTTVTTLEAETEDDVSDLDQALIMAKNAILNGQVDIDSVTIENVKEEQPKESTENNLKNNTTLNEDDSEHYAPLPHLTPITNYILQNFDKNSDAYKVAFRIQNDLITGRLKDRNTALEELKKYVTLKNNFEEAEYIPESEINTTITEEINSNKILDYTPAHKLSAYTSGMNSDSPDFIKSNQKEIENPTEEDMWNVANKLKNDWKMKDEQPEWLKSFYSLINANVPWKIVEFILPYSLSDDEAKRAPHTNNDYKYYEEVKKLKDNQENKKSNLQTNKNVKESALIETDELYNKIIKIMNGVPGMEEATAEYQANHVGSPEKVAENMVQRQYNFIISNLPESDILRQQAENIFAKFERGEINAIDTKIALGGVAYEVQKKLWGESCSKKEIEEYIPESEMPEINMPVNESVLIEADKLYEEIYNIIKEQNVPVDKACRIYCEKHDNIPYEYILEYMKDVPGMEEALKEAKEEKKDPKEGKKFVLKTPSGFVAMDGNALVFKDDPKQALHFISGKEESGLVHLSGVQKILDTMGVYDVEKYYRKPTTDISISGEIANNEDAAEIDISTITEEPKKEATLQEEDTTGGKFTAIVEVEELGGQINSDEIPVASTELSSMQNEIGNLYQQKAQNGNVRIKIRDNESGTLYMYNPELNSFDTLQESTDGEIKQDDEKLSIDIDDEHSIEKKFDTKAQASVAKAGIEQGKLDGNVLLSEEDNDDWKIAVLFNNLDFGNEEKLYNNADPTSSQSIFNGNKPKFIRVFLYPEELGTNNPENLIITSEGNKLINDKAAQKLEDKIGTSGNVYSVRVWKRDETSKDMKDKDFEKDIYELDEGTEEWDYHYSGVEQSNLKNEDNPSLSYDLENSAICAWCGDRLPKSEMRHESKLGWLCNHCARGIQSREGRLEFDEEAPHYENIQPGWYVSCPKAAEFGLDLGIAGPFKSKEDAISGLEGYEKFLQFDEITSEDLGIAAESNKMDEVLFKHKSNASDPYIDEPLNEEDETIDLTKPWEQITLYDPNDKNSYLNFQDQNDDTVKVTYAFQVNNADGIDYETDSQIMSYEEAKGLMNKFNHWHSDPNFEGFESVLNEDDKEKKPSEDDVNSNPDEEVIITLGNIDWDIESLSTSNKDIEQMITDLPETLQLTVKAGDLNADEPEQVRDTLMNLANKSSSMKINDATIIDIK